MIKNIILDFDKDPEKVTDEDLYSYSGRKNIEKVLAVEAIVNTTKLSLSALGDFFINLQKLRLDNSTITTVRDIGCTFRNLRYLSLNNCGITSLNGISTLSQNIEELYLQNNLIKDVSDLMGMDQLRIIDLTNNKITDAANLQFLSCCSNLKTLYFGGNPAINNDNFQSDLKKYAPQLNVILNPRQDKNENTFRKNTYSSITKNDQNNSLVTENSIKLASNDISQNKSKVNKKSNETNSKNQDSKKSNDSQKNNSKIQENHGTNKAKDQNKKDKEATKEFLLPVQKKEITPLITDKMLHKNEKKNDTSNTNNNKNTLKDEKNSNIESQSIKDQKNIKKKVNEQKNELINQNSNKISKKDEKEIPILENQNKNKDKQQFEALDSTNTNNSLLNKKNDKRSKIEISDKQDDKKRKDEQKIDKMSKKPENIHKNATDKDQILTKADEIPIFEGKKDDRNDQKKESKRASEITEFEIAQMPHKKHKRHHSVNNNSKDNKTIEKDRKDEFEKVKSSKIESKTENSGIELDSKQEKSLKPNTKTISNKDNQNNDYVLNKDMKIHLEAKNDNNEVKKIHSTRNPKEEARIIQPNPEESFILESNATKHHSNINSKLNTETKKSERTELMKNIKSSSNHKKSQIESDKKIDSDQDKKSDRKSQKRNSLHNPDSELFEILQKSNLEDSKKKKREKETNNDHLFSQKHDSKSNNSTQNNFKPSPPTSPPLTVTEDGTNQINPARRPVIFGPTKIKNKTDPFSLSKSNKGPIENESENSFSHHHHHKSQERHENQEKEKEQSKAKKIEEIFTSEEQNFFEPKQKDQIRVRSSKTPSELAYKRSQKSNNNNNSSFDNFIFHNNNNITADFELYKPSKGKKIDTFDFTGDFDFILEKNSSKDTNSSRRQKSKNLRDIEIKRVKRSPSELSDSSHQKVESRDFEDKKTTPAKKSTLPPIDSSVYPHSSASKGKKNSNQPEMLLVDDNSDDGFSSSKRPGSKLSSRLGTVTPTAITTSNGAAQKYLPSPRSKIITRPL